VSRHRRLLPALALVLGLAPLGVASEKEDQQKIIDLGREDNQVMDHLDYLSNRLGPRLTGSDGLQNACEWAVDRFKGFGIDNARLEQWGEFPVGFNRGPWSGKMVEPEAKALTFGTNSWTAGTKGVQRGPAVIAPANAEELEEVKDKLAGAWVLATRGRGGDNDFRQELQKAYDEAGVAGLIYPVRGDRIITAGNQRITWDKLPTRPQVDLVQDQYDEIARLLKEDKPVTLEFDIRNYFEDGPIPLYNVIADIPGTEKPDEYVIVGGHIDSWDGATGTTDNGTGCATTLEAARLLMKAGVKPKRTIRFMLWSGEEQGLLGSIAYVKAHPELMDKISAVLVHDGGTNYLSGIGVTKAMRGQIEEALSPLTGLNEEFPFAIREVNGLRGGGSDHASFLAAGVPGFFWGQAGKASYPRTHHTQYDTYDAAIPEYQKHSSIVVALAALGIADLPELLNREGLTPPRGALGNIFGGNRRLLGVQLDDLTVQEVVEGSPAEAAGVKPGDILMRLDGKDLGDRDTLSEALQGGPSTKKLIVRRDGSEVELTVKFPDAQP
jgi:hypothetical protein